MTAVTEQELYTATLGEPDHQQDTDRSQSWHWYLPDREPDAEGWRPTAKLYIRHHARRGYVVTLETGELMRGPYFMQERMNLFGPALGPTVQLARTQDPRFSRVKFRKLFTAMLAECRKRASEAARVAALAEARCNLAGEDPNDDAAWAAAMAEARAEATAESILDEVLGQ